MDDDSCSVTSKRTPSLISLPSTTKGAVSGAQPKAATLAQVKPLKCSKSLPPIRPTTTPFAETAPQSEPTILSSSGIDKDFRRKEKLALQEAHEAAARVLRKEKAAQKVAQEAAQSALLAQKQKEKAVKKKLKEKQLKKELQKISSAQSSSQNTSSKKDKASQETSIAKHSDTSGLTQNSVLPSSSSKRRRSLDSEEEASLDPTLDSQGKPSRIPHSPPSAQKLDIHDDENYPALTPKRAKIRSMERSILALVKAREDFEKFSEDDIIITAENLFNSGISSLEELKKSRPVNRTFILEDLRAKKLSARDLELILALFHTFPAQTRDGSNKKALLEELHIPTLTKSFTGDLMTLSPLLAPDQALVNEISRQLKEGENCVPRYTPFVTAQLHLEPFRSQFHDNIVVDWADRMKSMRSAQPLPFQAYLLFQMRFILAGQICSAWSQFGGFSAQMNAHAVLLNIAISDNVGVAIAYDMQIRKHISHLARQRRNDVDYAQLLSKENEDIKKQVLAQRAAKQSNPDKDLKNKDKGKGKGKGKGNAAGKGKPWGKGHQYKNWHGQDPPNHRYGPHDRPAQDRATDNDKRRSEGRSGRSRSPKRSDDKNAQKKKDHKK